MSDESTDTPKLTKKQRRKAAQRRQLLTFLGIVVLVAVVAGVVLGVQKYLDSRGGDDPADLRITAVSADGEETQLAPYSVCGFDDTDCGGDEPSPVSLPADGEITLKLPADVYDHDWKLFLGYDNPGANDDQSFTGHEKQELTLRGSSGKKDENGENPRLVVAEIQTLLIRGSGDDEEPVAVVWSLAPQD